MCTCACALVIGRKKKTRVPSRRPGWPVPSRCELPQCYTDLLHPNIITSAEPTCVGAAALLNPEVLNANFVLHANRSSKLLIKTCKRPPTPPSTCVRAAALLDPEVLHAQLPPKPLRPEQVAVALKHADHVIVAQLLHTAGRGRKAVEVGCQKGRLDGVAAWPPCSALPCLPAALGLPLPLVYRQRPLLLGPQLSAGAALTPLISPLP